MSRDAPRLGRGLKSLMSVPLDDEVRPSSDDATGPVRAESGTVMAPMDRIARNRFQPRRQVDPERLEQLARSIASDGVIQPIVVRRDGEGFELIAGERRWLAAQKAGLESIPVVVREASDEEMLRVALIENIHREDLTAIDRAEAYREFGQRFRYSPEQMASEFGEDRTTITNYLRLLALPEPVRDMVASGELGMGHARAILGVDDPEEQINLARMATSQSLSVRRIEELVRLRKGGKASLPTAEREKPPKAPHVRDLEERLSQSLKTKVAIHEGRSRHTGRIVLEYYNLDDFDRITRRLGLADE